MPKGPLGLERPGTEAIQTLELGAFGKLDEQESTAFGELLIDVFGTDEVGTQTTPEISGGVLNIPLGANKVFLEDIKRVLEQEVTDSVADNLWSVRASARGKAGEIRPLVEAQQMIRIQYGRIPEIALGYEREFEMAIIEGLVDDGWPPGAVSSVLEGDELKSVNVDFKRQEARILLNKNVVSNTLMNAIESRAGKFTTGFINTILEEEKPRGNVEEMTFDEIKKQGDEIQRLDDELRTVEYNQIIIEAV